MGKDFWVLVGRKPMFYLHEKVVYPGHGIAEVNRVVEKNIGGESKKLLELRFLHKEMVVLVPLSNVDEIGLRKLSSKSDIDNIYKVFAIPTDWKPNENVSTSWSKKSKKYQTDLSSGDIYKISKIYRELKNISVKKELSFGERALLQQAETLLAQEISMVQDIFEDKAKNQLRSFFGSPIVKISKHSEKTI